MILKVVFGGRHVFRRHQAFQASKCLTMVSFVYVLSDLTANFIGLTIDWFPHEWLAAIQTAVIKLAVKTM